MININWNQLYLDGRDYRLMNSLLLDELLSAANLKNGGLALDIGCGTGDLSIKLAQKNFIATGIDLSPAAVVKAAERSKAAGTATKTNFHVMDIENPEGIKELDGQSFDLITCKLVFPFISDKSAFLDWIKVHLSQRGVFVLITPVLHPGIGYGQRLKSISIDYEELMIMLNNNFSEIREVHKDYFEELGDERTFVLK